MFRQGQTRRRGKHNGLQRQNTCVLRMNTTFGPRRKKFTERCVNSLQEHVTEACVQTPRSPSCPAHPARCEARLFLRTRESRYKQRLIHTHDHRAGGQPFTIRMGHGFHLNIPTIRADHQHVSRQHTRSCLWESSQGQACMPVLASFSFATTPPAPTSHRTTI